ncbi:hypothetical protein DPMN_101851 [Dreissena polymorpha]|uniref:Uncharacterized protein n=1 Tax=Dreissena polymorpha TaxID=45954 RepID=A0A9D4LJF5_DREPO|nr:hypothetical protein DPMN_101851 [Dreissena polymorpha]
MIVVCFFFQQHVLLKSKVPSYFKSTTSTFHRNPSKSSQVYQEVAPGQKEQDPVGRPIGHLSAQKQVSGEAVYIDDIPKLHSMLKLNNIKN